MADGAEKRLAWVCGAAVSAETICQWLGCEASALEQVGSVDALLGRLTAGQSELVILVHGTPDELSRLLAADRTACVVVLLEAPSVTRVVRLMQCGARAVAGTGAELATQLRELLAATRPDLVRPRWTQTERTIFARIVNRSAAMNSVIEKVRAISRAPDTTAMILGESGTGKELVANAIHLLSSRKDRPFIAVDCGAIPDNLFESELFGYERGAFSGAVEERKGRFELANGGTVFLDEVGELPPAMQAKLLRVLEEREVWRLGARAPRAIDVRVLAATNRDLRKAVERDHFRADLFFRLNVFPITLPSLRERGADVLHLAQHFFDQFNQELSRGLLGLTPAAKAKLVAYEYPGNVRELRNAIETAVISSAGPLIDAPDITVGDPNPSTAFKVAATAEGISLQLVFGKAGLENLERAAVSAALERAGGNQTRAAELLGIRRLALARAAARLGITIARLRE